MTQKDAPISRMQGANETSINKKKMNATSYGGLLCRC